MTRSSWLPRIIWLVALGGLASLAYTQYSGGGYPWSLLALPGTNPAVAAATATTDMTLQSAPPPEQSSTAPADDGEQWVEVSNTDRLGVYIRGTPNMEDRLKAWPDGTKLQVIGPDVHTPDRRWKNVQDPDGRAGWVPAQYLIPAPVP